MSPQNLPFYVTWSKQKNPLVLSLSHQSNHYFFDQEGKKYLNLSSTSYQSSFGLKNKIITNSIKNQMKDFSIASPKHLFDLKYQISERLLEKVGNTGPKKYKVFYTLSGSEGIENAIKLVRFISKKSIILSRKKSYHGATLGALSITGDWRRDGHPGVDQNRLFIPEPSDDLDGQKFKKIIESKHQNIAGVCLETITGGNGVIIPDAKWYLSIRKTLNEYKIPLILDEVVCGVHRTGPFFGFQNYSDLKPDIIVMAKALSGGYFPIGCNIISKNLTKQFEKEKFPFGLTNYAHPLGLAAIKGVLSITEDPGFQERKKSNEYILNEFMTNLPAYTERRSIGLLGAIKCPSLTQEDIYKNELYIAKQGDNIILAPPLNISPKLLKSGLKKLKSIM